MILSEDKEETSSKIPHSLIIKTLKEMGIEVTCLNIIKAICDNPPADINLNYEKSKMFPLKSGALSHLLFDIILKVLDR